MKIIVLGSGTSHGIPVVGCNCPVCTSDDPRDKRMRSSVYIEGRGGEKALIDAGPEFRLQAVRAGINRLDGIFLTHSHADHLHGLDDVRSLSRDNPIPVYGNKKTIKEMKVRFSYAFGTRWGAQQGGGKPKLMPVIVNGPVRAGNLTFTPVPVKHGVLDILGWEVEENVTAGIPRDAAKKSFLYLTDTSAIPPASMERLQSRRLQDCRRPRVIIIGGLRERAHETHFSFEEALNAASGLGAEKVFLTHICHSHSHAEIEEFCGNFRKSREIRDTEFHPAQDELELAL